MSLIKLLSVSRSFVGGANQGGRYRMAEQAMLPKFAPVGRPISLSPKGNLQPPATESNSDWQEPKSARARIATSRAAPALESTTKKALSFTTRGSDTTALSQSGPKTCPNTVPLSTNWFRLRKNPFTYQSTGGTVSQIPVQAELSLDSVRPVRNDLIDADLEVVAAKLEAPSVESRKPDGRRWFKPSLTGFAWSRLTARWFGSERVRA